MCVEKSLFAPHAYILYTCYIYTCILSMLYIYMLQACVYLNLTNSMKNYGHVLLFWIISVSENTRWTEMSIGVDVHSLCLEIVPQCHVVIFRIT